MVKSTKKIEELHINNRTNLNSSVNNNQFVTRAYNNKMHVDGHVVLSLFILFLLVVEGNLPFFTSFAFNNHYMTTMMPIEYANLTRDSIEDYYNHY